MVGRFKFAECVIVSHRRVVNEHCDKRFSMVPRWQDVKYFTVSLTQSCGDCPVDSLCVAHLRSPLSALSVGVNAFVPRSYMAFTVKFKNFFCPGWARFLGNDFG